ncbi:MAG: sugar phosphate isomerase/epimerase family protein [Armatimonadota bacterium]|jgi:sugar phosphate isomerase/epimerase
MIKLAYHPNSYLRHEVGVDEAIAHIAEVGWDGFEWSSTTLADHFGTAEGCRERLDGLGIRISGIYHPCRFETKEQIDEWTERAAQALEFARTVGADVLMLDGGSTDLPITSESIRRVADAAGRVARMTCDAGMVCTWHQHWNTLFQYPDEFHALMDATDPDELKCTLDTAHLTLGGFDVPATFRRYAHRLRYVHLKDLAADRRFADLGAGTVNLAEAAQILIESEFSGWVVNDLDYTDNDPFDTSHHNLRFLKDLLG